MAELNINIDSPLLSDLFSCFGLPGTDPQTGESELNYYASLLKTVVKKVLLSLVGAMADLVGRITKAIAELVKITDPVQFQKYVNDYIIEPLETLGEYLTPTWLIEWVVSLVNEIENLKCPVPEINLGFATIPGNKAYRELIAQMNPSPEWIYRKFNPVVKFITEFIVNTINTMLGKLKNSDGVSGFLDFITPILEVATAAVDKIPGLIDKILQIPAKLIEWFLKLTGILVFKDIVDGWIITCIKFFVDGATEIADLVNYLYVKVIECVSPPYPSIDEFIDGLDITIHPMIKTIFKFIICMLKFVINLMVFLFSFEWMV